MKYRCLYLFSNFLSAVNNRCGSSCKNNGDASTGFTKMLWPENHTKEPNPSKSSLVAAAWQAGLLNAGLPGESFMNMCLCRLPVRCHLN